MGIPKENLAQGERVILERHPHWKCLVAPLLIFIVTTGVAGVLGGLVNDRLDGTARTWILGIILVIWLAVAGWYLVRPLVSWKTTHFVVTNRRVIFRNGIITRSGNDIPLQRINTVEFEHGLIDRLLNTGSLVIESASDEPLTFNNIPQVERVHALLYQEVLDDDNDPDSEPRR
ncbi:PH domain-containing protein [Gordonia amarae]|uniref:YdbS-like PH domain-containing protein n=2 Tax=Gordonia amarae TaxID=36821 RepID=G7GR95_9ACTN|nr:PH domain-containing protein [Gordonia amarae]MCS3878356.1 putative membrane protein YdbT with pleckstrin-like domain [Gordonia amarae]QHN16996.1 PH domain-containing protein [Gordonia amarae]QHN21522.1 PH domain-containing protein [Gordonia amarae]QHN30372.1 PH domain-containing protein [Gordonia amarae]QHN39149.1 PH domain-containing protein [Gordonia amarae]